MTSSSGSERSSASGTRRTSSGSTTTSSRPADTRGLQWSHDHGGTGPAEADRAADFGKSFGTRMLIPLLGNGLLTAEGEEWLRHRRLASGAFHRERVAGHGRTMAAYADEMVDAWHDGEPIDLHDA